MTGVTAGQRLVQILKNEKVLEALEEQFDRSFDITITGDDAIKLTIASKDSGSEWMTVADVAHMLQIDRATIRRMTEARAQRAAVFPIPFLKPNGQMLRFYRPAIMEWLQKMVAAGNPLPPPKGKQPKKPTASVKKAVFRVPLLQK